MRFCFFLCLMACLLLVGASVGNLAVAQPQELSCPAILKELYYPASLQMTFTSTNMITYGKVISPPNIAFQFGETSTGPPQDQLTVVWMTQNTTATWTLDFFINYTVPTPQYVLYSITEIDSTGIPKTHQDSCYTATDKVWIHFQITTRAAPRPPTLSETFGFLLQPGNLLVRTLDANNKSVDDLVGLVYLTFGAAAIAALIGVFNLIAVAAALSRGD